MASWTCHDTMHELSHVYIKPWKGFDGFWSILTVLLSFGLDLDLALTALRLVLDSVLINPGLGLDNRGLISSPSLLYHSSKASKSEMLQL